MNLSQPLLDAISAYHDNYRLPRLEHPDVSGVYALFPDDPVSAHAQYRWPQTWPHSDRPGIYLILDGDRRLRYVGKANRIGARLSAYFQYSKDTRGCHIAHTTWKSRPMFVVTVALGKPFEASAFEEYLISALQPEENVLGVGKSIDQL
jgi:GIY-YIG catalytic domain